MTQVNKAEEKTEEKVQGPGSDYKKPKGSKSELEVLLSAGSKKVESEADWIILRKDDEPAAEMFFIRYFLEDEKQRPITFVFNGGPGASSVYLHMVLLDQKGFSLKTKGNYSVLLIN